MHYAPCAIVLGDVEVRVVSDERWSRTIKGRTRDGKLLSRVELFPLESSLHRRDNVRGIINIVRDDIRSRNTLYLLWLITRPTSESVTIDYLSRQCLPNSFFYRVINI